MTKETIRDRTGRIIGYIVTESNGNAYSEKFVGGRVGTYNKYTDEVYKFAGGYVGKGKGLLASLLFS